MLGVLKWLVIVQVVGDDGDSLGSPFVDCCLLIIFGIALVVTNNTHRWKNNLVLKVGQ